MESGNAVKTEWEGVRLRMEEGGLAGKEERQNPVCGEGMGSVSGPRTQSVKRESGAVEREERGSCGDGVEF